MKVLLILTSMPGFKGEGDSSFNAVFIEELTRLGIEVTVIRIRSINPIRPLCIKTVIDKDVLCYTLCACLPPLFFRPLFLPRLFTHLFKKLRLDYDVVHAGNGWIAIAAAIAARLKSVDYLVQFIGDDVNTDLKDLIESKQYLQALKGARFHIFNSAQLLKVFHSYYHDSAVRSAVIRRGVRLNEFVFHYNLGEEIVIVFLGGVPRGNEKGFFTLVEAIKIVDDCQLEHNLSFVLAGPGTFKYKDILVLRNQKIKVKFVGELARSKVIRLLNDSNVVVIPSLNEGIPNVLYEAMASGNMVIASDVGGIAEVLQDGISGWLIRPNRPDELADSIIKATAEKDQLINYALKGRTIIEELGHDKFISSYIQIYKTLTSKMQNLDGLIKIGSCADQSQ